ncbi:MAG: HAD-IA family hydrolase [Methylotetracoccus sp.]|nr:HAD-IA family hydrolase [Methylotetracoccus sp.]
MPAKSEICGVLFDLDGTLLDTAPDLIFAVNSALREVGLPESSDAELTPLISRGAPTMLRRGLGGSMEPFEPLLERMLDLYQSNVAVHTRLFQGMDRVLDSLDRASIPWGIVTNKLSRFTDPLIRALRLDQRTPCVISGDTTRERKPHPLPLLEACKRITRDPAGCLFVGDALSDVEAGRRAGMSTLAAVYGYLAEDDQPEQWAADGLIGHPEELIPWLTGVARPAARS